MQVSTLGWRDHIGRTGTGRVLQGRLQRGDCPDPDHHAPHPARNGSGNRPKTPASDWEVTGIEDDRAVHLWATRGIESVPCSEVSAGDIVTLAGPKALSIGDTLAAPELEDCALPAARSSKSRPSR
ncbi:MAG: hypothetical protein ACOX5J_08700 [Candidatus Hydrogenedentales bacterium]